MAPTYSNGQEMVSIYLIKIKITTKFFKSMDEKMFQKKMLPGARVCLIRVRNLKFATCLKFAVCGNTNKINELR